MKCAKCLEVKREGDHNVHGLKICKECFDNSLFETKHTKQHANPSEVRDKFAVFFNFGLYYDVFGKWMMFDYYDKLDTTWKKIRTAMARGELYGCSAKCTTMRYDPTKEGPGPSTSGVICVYTRERNVEGVGFKLIQIVKRDIMYKTVVDTRNYKFKHAGTLLNKDLKRIYWNHGKPSHTCTDGPCYNTISLKRADMWHLNVVIAPEPFGSMEASGRWILKLENRETTSMWHIIKDRIESGNKAYDIIKMECPRKLARESRTEKPTFYVYTSRDDHKSVGMNLIELVKRDLTFEHRPQRGMQGVMETLYWNHGKPVYKGTPHLPTVTQALIENQHRKAYEEVIKDKRTLNMRSIRFINVGIPRSGKTTFWRRLMKQIVNLSTPAREKEQSSTGLAEQHQVVIKEMKCLKSMLTPDDWCTLNEDEEAKMILQLFFDSISSADASPAIPAALNPSHLRSFAEISIGELADNLATLSTSNPHQLQPEMLTAEIPGGPSPSLLSLPEPDYSPQMTLGIKEIFPLIFNKAMESTGEWEKLKYALEQIILLSSTDTGGHAEFLGMHAALINGPSFNLLFSRLDQELGDLFRVYFTDEEGKSTEKEDSDSTVKEVLLQTLSSITCFGNCHRSRASDDSPLGIEESLKARQSKVLFVGTYKDKVTEEDIRKRDEEVRQLIENTELFENVLFAGEKQPMLTVDNMNGGEDEIDNIREILKKKIKNSFAKLPIPASWLVLSLIIRICNVPTMNLKECEEIAAKLDIDSNELQTALWFLHHGFGVLLYYPVEGLKDIVFCKIQEVFNSVTSLIKKTYTHDIVDTPSLEKFKKEGEFSLNNIPEDTPDTPIGRKMLTKLLEHLNIITAISTPGAAAEGPTYFMPCVLRSARKVDDPQPGDGDPSPLILRYDCGYTPMGVFPALVTNLVSQSGWKIIKGELYKNRVQFHVLPESDCDTVTLISHYRYFKVCVSRRKRSHPQQETTESLCCQIRNVISSTLKIVTSQMNYDFKMGYQYGFKCPTHPESVCVLHNETATCMHCLQDQTHILDLESHHTLWFTQGTSTKTSAGSYSPRDHIPKGASSPSLRQIISFPMGDGRVNLLEKIGADYFKFGVFLLQDDYSSRTKAVEKEMRGNPSDINCEIIRLWLRGQGIQPVSWDTFTIVLQDIGLNDLAKVVQENSRMFC